MLQLLKEYRAWHTAYGGAMPLEETGVVDASYGPAGYIYEGIEYRKRDRKRLAESYEALEHAINLRKRTPHGFAAWVLLHGPYFGDPGDPGIVRIWRETDDYRIQWHDDFVADLAHDLRHVDLHVVWPDRMTVRREAQIEKRNDEFYDYYQQIKAEQISQGVPKSKANRKAIRDAAAMCGYSEPRGYEIVRIRESGAKGKAKGKAS